MSLAQKRGIQVGIGFTTSSSLIHPMNAFHIWNSLNKTNTPGLKIKSWFYQTTRRPHPYILGPCFIPNIYFVGHNRCTTAVTHRLGLYESLHHILYICLYFTVALQLLQQNNSISLLQKTGIDDGNLQTTFSQRHVIF